MGPRKERGTTPGKRWWSYSPSAWRLNDSSTLVYGQSSAYSTGAASSGTSHALSRATADHTCARAQRRDGDPVRAGRTATGVRVVRDCHVRAAGTHRSRPLPGANFELRRRSLLSRGRRRFALVLRHVAA
eukprot:2910415-Prymnesium_polylepis.2